MIKQSMWCFFHRARIIFIIIFSFKYNTLKFCPVALVYVMLGILNRRPADRITTLEIYSKTSY